MNPIITSTAFGLATFTAVAVGIAQHEKASPSLHPDYASCVANAAEPAITYTKTEILGGTLRREEIPATIITFDPEKCDVVRITVLCGTVVPAFKIVGEETVNGKHFNLKDQSGHRCSYTVERKTGARSHEQYDIQMAPKSKPAPAQFLQSSFS